MRASDRFEKLLPKLSFECLYEIHTALVAETDRVIDPDLKDEILNLRLSISLHPAFQPSE